MTDGKQIATPTQLSSAHAQHLKGLAPGSCLGFSSSFKAPPLFLYGDTEDRAIILYESWLSVVASAAKNLDFVLIILLGFLSMKIT